MVRRTTLRGRIETRIARRRGEDVFLPREFADLGGEDQVLRVLRGLVREGRLVRLGYGVYGRAVVSELSGKPMLYSPNGFAGAARQALTKLGVKWEPTEAERAYNEGRSTQVPVNPAVRVRGRFSRQLRYGNAELVLARRGFFRLRARPRRAGSVLRAHLRRGAAGRMGPHDDLWRLGEATRCRAGGRARCRSSHGQESGGADHTLSQGFGGRR